MTDDGRPEWVGNRPPAPPRYRYDVKTVMLAARTHGMGVEFDLFHDGYGWVYCPACGWGKGADREGRDHWTLDLSVYQREPWGCAYCRHTGQKQTEGSHATRSTTTSGRRADQR